jgi:tetratricopeptide (TPR) repeat protein
VLAGLVFALVAAAPLRAQDTVDTLLRAALERLEAGRGFDALDVLSRAKRIDPRDARAKYASSGVATTLAKTMQGRLDADEAARGKLPARDSDRVLHYFAAALTAGVSFDSHGYAFDLCNNVDGKTAPLEVLAWEARFAWRGYPDPNLEARPGTVASFYRTLLERGRAADRDLGWHLEAAVGARNGTEVALDCERLAALGADDACLRVLAAWAHNRLGRADLALERSEAALAVDPGNAFALFERGLARAQRGELDLARADWSESLRLRPDRASPRLALVLLDFAQGRSGPAQAGLERLPASLREQYARKREPAVSLRPWFAWFLVPAPSEPPSSPATEASLIERLRPWLADCDLEFLRPLVRIDGTAWDGVLAAAQPESRKHTWTSAFASSVLDVLITGRAIEALAICDDAVAREPGSSELLALRGGIERGLEQSISLGAFVDLEDAKQLDPGGEYLAGVYEARTFLGCVPGGELASSNGWQRAAEGRPQSIEYALFHARYANWGEEKLAPWREEYYRRVLVLEATNDAERAWQAEARLALETHHGPTELEVDALSKRLEENPADVPLLLARARAFERKGDLAAALQDVEGARAAAPRDLAVLELRSELHRKQGDMLARLEDSELALAIDPKNVEWLSLSAWILESFGRYEEALAKVGAEIEVASRNHWRGHDEARLLKLLGRRQEAILVYTWMLEHLKGSDVECLRAELRLQEHDLAGAIADLRGWNERHPGDADALRLLDRAVAESEGTDERTARLARIVAGEPTSVAGFATRADAHAERGEWQAAWDDFTRGLALDPDDLYTHMHRASVAMRLGKYAEAAQDCRRVIAAKPEWGEFRDQLFDACLRAGDWDGALAAGAETLERFPNQQGPALICQAIVFHQKQNWPAAVNAWRKALAFSPSDATTRCSLSNALQNLGCARMSQGNHLAARNAFDEAIALTPGDALAYYNRAFARYHCGDWTAAQRDNETARKLDGSLAEVEFVSKPKPVEAKEVQCPECSGFGASGGGGSWVDQRSSDTSTVIRWDASTGYSSSTSITGSHGGFVWQGSSVTTCATCNGTGKVWR